MKYICKICGKEFIRYDYRNKKNLYCSKNCAAIGRTKFKKISIKCSYCGKEFERKENRIRYKNSFCSIECANKYQGRNKLKFICITCGKEFYRPKSWIKQKRGYYCSLECRNEDEEWKKRSCYNANAIQNRKRGFNKIELKGMSILDKLNIKYLPEYLINDKICVDVFVPDYNLIIQWDGNYWHGKDLSSELLDYRQKKRVDLDKSQDAYFKKCGFKELRFWEDEIMEQEDYICDCIRKTIDDITKRVS